MTNNTSTNPLYLSTGTCYFGAGQLSSSHYLPCGNAALSGPQPCCYSSDYCLSSSTCWDPITVVTYIAGCTDSLFRDSACPQRYNYPDQQWVALARCDGDDEDLWSGCAYHPEEVEISKEDCSCNVSNVLIQNPNGKGSFDEVGLLPSAVGEAIVFNPTAVPTAIASSHTGGGGLSTGAKAGIGVGVGIGGLLLIAGAILLVTMARRRKNQSNGDFEHAESELPGSGLSSEKSELAGDHYRGASVDTHKSELPPDGKVLELEDPNGVDGKGAGLSEMGVNTPHPGH